MHKQGGTSNKEHPLGVFCCCWSAQHTGNLFVGWAFNVRWCLRSNYTQIGNYRFRLLVVRFYLLFPNWKGIWAMICLLLFIPQLKFQLREIHFGRIPVVQDTVMRMSFTEDDLHYYYNVVGGVLIFECLYFLYVYPLSLVSRGQSSKILSWNLYSQGWYFRACTKPSKTSTLIIGRSLGQICRWIGCRWIMLICQYWRLVWVTNRPFYLPDTVFQTQRNESGKYDGVVPEFDPRSGNRINGSAWGPAAAIRGPYEASFDRSQHLDLSMLHLITSPIRGHLQ